ncbi:MAG: hypothetical protein R6W78_03100 [Bacteroidales bacterium]
MKKAIFLIVLLILIISCEKEKQHDKFFNPVKFGQLNLGNLDGFWDANELIDTSDYTGFPLNYPGLLEGISLSQQGKMIFVSAFSNPDTALIAMDFTIDNAANIIREGTTNDVKGKWWYSFNPGNNSVHVIQWNTIIVVVFFNANTDEVKDILYATANELAKRVDGLSE